MQIWKASQTARKWSKEDVGEYLCDSVPIPLTSWLRERSHNLRKTTKKCYLVFNKKEVQELIRHSRRWLPEDGKSEGQIACDFIDHMLCKLQTGTGGHFVATYIPGRPKDSILNIPNDEVQIAIQIRNVKS